MNNEPVHDVVRLLLVDFRYSTYPVIRGPMTGPINGEIVYNAMGLAILSFVNMSPTLPPATLKNAEDAAPPRKRKMRNTAIRPSIKDCSRQ